ncbi:MAG: hypothetical protein ABIH21_04950 [Patescibacteria group bacterium]
MCVQRIVIIADGQDVERLVDALIGAGLNGRLIHVSRDAGSMKLFRKGVRADVPNGPLEIEDPDAQMLAQLAQIRVP